MSYTKYAVLLCVLAGGCASLDSQRSEPLVTSEQAGQTDNTTSSAEQEIAQYTQALTHLNENRLNEAEQLLSAITQKRPELAGPWANLGLVYIKKNQLDKAEQAVRKALEKNTSLAQGHNLLGVIETKRGNINAAKDHYLKALQIKEDYALVHHNLALLYDLYLRELPKAVEHYKRYLELVDHQDTRTADWLKELIGSLNRSGT